MPKRKNVTAWRLVMNSKQILADAEDATSEAMADVLLEAEKNAKDRLQPGQGVDTGTMKRRTHVAEQGYDWAGDHVEPASGTAELGGQRVLPTRQKGGRANNALVLELGCGQNYTIYYHAQHDPFLRQAWEEASQELPGQVALEMAKRGY